MIHRRTRAPWRSGSRPGSRRVLALISLTIAAGAASPAASATEVLEPVAGALATGSTDLWDPPLGRPLRIDRAYSLVNGPYGAGHRGIDLPARVGQEVRAPAAGVVSYVGVVVDRPVLSIRVDAATVVSFDSLASDLTLGEAVDRGDVVGTATLGHCAEESPCVHFGVRVNHAYVNPLRYLRERPRLLPWE